MAKNIPFVFVLDYLMPLKPTVRPMFGCHAVYVGEKIVLVLRHRYDHPEANGVWIATSSEHHASLKKDLPNMCSVYILSEGKSETNWQMIQLSADDFEASVTAVCEFILQRDERIGRIPKPRKRKTHL